MGIMVVPHPKMNSVPSGWLTQTESLMTAPTPRPWPFVPTLRLASVAMLVAIVSLMLEGWMGTVLMIVAMFLALWGVTGYVRAWRKRSQS